jgi:hypothetical protein
MNPFTREACDIGGGGGPRTSCRSTITDSFIPAIIYTFSIVLLTFPACLHWSTDFFCNNGDGLQNEWNLWWIRKAIIDLHQSPWFTTWLHAPRGTTLIGHTLNPINGVIGIPLSLLFSPVQVFNLIVIGSFVFSGVTAFWLARHIVKQYVPALLGGFAFAFTGYRFAHAREHMQLISTEFIPRVLLAWLRILEKPRAWRAVAAGVALGLVALCDFYYLFYCVMAGALCAICYFPRLRRIARRSHRTPWRVPLQFGLFTGVATICCAPLVIPLLIQSVRDPFVAAHHSVDYSSDAFSVFLPGSANMLGRFTEHYWGRLHQTTSEECVYVGLSVLALAIYGILKYRGPRRVVSYWRALAFWSYLLSLGPVLHVYGVEETRPMMPYAWLEQLLPPLKLSGCPDRISIMFALAMSMLMSLGIREILQRHQRAAAAVVCVFAIIMAIDLSPTGLATIRVPPAHWATVLRDLPEPGSVIAKVDGPGSALYYQTLFDRPMAYGYISRVPQRVDASDRQIAALVQAGDFAALRKMGFVYLVLPADGRVDGLPKVYADDQVNILQIQ